MIKAFESPCLSLHLQHPLRGQGIRTSLQLPTRQITLRNCDKESKYGGFSCQKISASAESFSTSFNEPTESILQPKDDQKVTIQSELLRKWDVFYRFSRLFSGIGVSIGVASIALLPVTSVGDLSPALFLGILKAVVPFWFANLYTGGINQVIDVPIDKINKPYLPLVSGEYSMAQGKAITSAFGFLCLAMAIVFQSPPLFVGILVYFLLGTAYSVEHPLLRWKTKPFLTVLFFIVIYGFDIQLSTFYHIQKYVLGRPIVFPKSLGFAMIVGSLFGIVLAMFKDIPDVEGDEKYGNRTFPVRHGKKNVFTFCMSLLLIVYGSGMVIGASSSNQLCKLVSVIGHGSLASFLLLRAKSLNLDDNNAIQSFLMFLWKLLYAEFALIQFIR